MNPSLAFLPLLTVLFLACAQENEPSFQKGDPNQILDSEAEGLANDPYTLQSARIVGDLLEIEVQYAGGCETHEFTLVWPEEITLIDTPDFSMELYHDSNGDLCEALISETIQFDLRQSPTEMSVSVLKLAKLSIWNASNTEESVEVK